MIEKRTRRRRTSTSFWYWNSEPPAPRAWSDLAQLSLNVQRERDRADRRNIEFSVLQVVISLEDWNEKNLSTLLNLLNNRLRITDDFGIISDGKIAILLPDTAADGASFVGSELKELAAEQGIKFRYQVFVYPFDEENNPPELFEEDQTTNGSSQNGDSFNGDLISSSSKNGDAHFEEDIPNPLLFMMPISRTKRALDVVASLGGLVCLSPLFLLVAVAIKLTSKGPVFFSQEREGQAGDVFRIHKFRTMREDAESMKADLRYLSERDGPAFKIENDPRVTFVGNILRKTCMDELPQLLNVLRGEMSLVGPRPLPVDESAACTPWQRRRLEVVPGLTCIWQVKHTSETTFDQWMRMDRKYMQQTGLKSDLKLMFRTIRVVLRLNEISD